MSNQQAWDFVAANLADIKAIARQRRFSRKTIEMDELVNEVAILAVQKFESYDPQRGTPRQWLYSLTMWAAQRNDRRYRPGEYVYEVNDELLESSGWGSAQSQERERMVREVQRKTEGKQRASVDSILAEANAEEIKATVGVCAGVRNWHIRNVAAQLGGEA